MTLLEKHYAYLAKKPFFAGLVKYTAGGPVCAMVWEGVNAVKTVCVILGETNPADYKPGIVRGEFAVQVLKLDGYDSQHDAYYIIHTYLSYFVLKSC